MRLFFKVIIFLCFGVVFTARGQDGPEILDNRVVIRFEQGYGPESIGKSTKNNALSRSTAGIREIVPAMPWISGSTRGRSAPHPLSDIYFLELQEGSDIYEMIDAMRSREGVAYAEPYYLFRPLNNINDPLSTEQQHLEVIRAMEAWAVEKGDSTILIGILDSGINPDHPDIMNNIYLNVNDPVNGIDDDGDGLVDNYMGWDIADNDNNPVDDTDAHGTWVAGVSSARTGNEVGISGTGYNARFLPIKIFRSGTNNFSKGYEAIALAADLGCDIINLSWGAEGAWSQFGQDVINYAVLEKDVAIVAAAGNTDGERDFFPASFDHVISVAATDYSDIKTSWGSYSRFVDITAPGSSILTTGNPDTYVRKGGTSLSAPQVAGALALVRSRFPELNALQAMERIRVHSDPILDLPGNRPYEGKLGKGRLNMFRALTEIGIPAIRVTDANVSNGSPEEIYHGDTIALDITLTNYLYPTGNLEVSISSSSPWIHLTDAAGNAGQIRTLESKKLSRDFAFFVDSQAPANEEIRIMVHFRDGVYEDYQHLTFTTAPDRVILTGGELALTVSGDGNLGFADDLYRNGIGLTWKENMILKNAAFLLSADGDVLDNLPSNFEVPVRDRDFSNERPIKKGNNSAADNYAFSNFQDTERDDLLIEQKILGWDDNDAIILEYRITNQGITTISELIPSLFSDFELGNPLENRSYWIDSLNISITESTAEGIFAGAAIISGGGDVIAVDKRNANGNLSDLPEFINDAVKKDILAAAEKDEAAGTQGSGNDVASFLRSTAIRLEPNESTLISYVMSASGSAEGLIQNIVTAKRAYAGFRERPPVLYTEYYCPGTVPVIDPPGGSFAYYLDPEGVNLISDGEILTGPGLDTLHQVFARALWPEGGKSDIFTIPLRSSLLNTNFRIEPDTLILDERQQTLVKFTDMSSNAVSWNWTFPNGYKSKRSAPAIHFTETGTYEVHLETINALGCRDEATKTLTVLRRTPQPEQLERSGCDDLSLAVGPNENITYRLYADKDKLRLITSGTGLNLNNIRTDSTLYYTRQEAGGIESLPAEISFDVFEVEDLYSWHQDSTNLGNPALIHFSRKSDSGTAEWFLEAGGNRTWLGMGTNISVDYTGLDDFSVILAVTNPEGCTSERRETFRPESRPAPENINSEVCAGNSFLLQPPAGFYHFYAGGQLIGKGSRLQIHDINADTLVLFTDVSGLLEGNKAEARISATKQNVFFDAGDGTHNMANGLPFIIEATGDPATEFLWTVNGREAGTARTLEYQFPEPGIYNLTLKASGETGCEGLFSRAIEVFNVTSSEFAMDDRITVFPNPTSYVLYLHSEIPVRTVGVWNMAGQQIHEWTDPDEEIDVSFLEEGLYLFTIRTDNALVHQKIRIDR